MRRLLLLILCLVPSGAAFAQNARIVPVQVAAGAVLTFHLQTRLRPGAGDAVDLLPKGTVLHVMVLDSIDSAVNRDGDSFQAVILSPLVADGAVVIHSDAKVRGVLALLRSQNHPEGFRYELLLTRVVDHGQSFALTASMDSQFADAGEAVKPSADAAPTREKAGDGPTAQSN